MIQALVGEWSEVVEAMRGPVSWWLAAAFFLGLFSMAILGLGWRRALHLVGLAASRQAALRWYFVGQLGKYVPGGIWAVVGSAELAVGGGASRARGYGAMVLSLGAAYLAGIVTVAALLPFELGLLYSAPSVALLLALVPVGLAAVHPVVLGRVLGLVRRFSPVPIELEVPTWGDSLGLVLRHIPAWLGVGVCTWFVAQGLGGASSFSNLALAGILAWVVGFLVVPAPGGLGVREAVFVAAATSLSSGMAAAVAVVARVMFVLVDGFGAAAVLVLSLARSRGDRIRPDENDEAQPPPNSGLGNTQRP